jgi:hypothetical protein
MDAIGAALTEADFGVPTGSSLEGSATGLAGSENGTGVVTGVLQYEVLFVSHSFLQNVSVGKEREEPRKLGIEPRRRILGNRLSEGDNEENSPFWADVARFRPFLPFWITGESRDFGNLGE